MNKVTILILIFVLLATAYFLFKSFMADQENKGIQESTISFIVESEGKKNNVYKDVAGFDTVGVGHKVLPNDKLKAGDEITNEKIKELLKKDLQITDSTIKRKVTVKLNQNQYDALSSLIFNIGSGAFQSSTLLKNINTNKSKDEIKSSWLAWKNAGGKPVLLSRREKEFNLYYS